LTLWTSLSVPLPRRRLDGCACKSPLAHFYIYHSESSLRELHPFTTTTHLASQNTITHSSEDDIEIQFLFRSRGKTAPSSTVNTPKLGFAPSLCDLIGRLRGQKTFTQWTERLAEVAHAEDISTNQSSFEASFQSELELTPITVSKPVPVSLRLEGPYFTPADPAHYRTVVCLVAGTGVSGALAISGAFKEIERQSAAMTSPGINFNHPRCMIGGPITPSPTQTQKERADSIILVNKDRIWTRCVVIWCVREEMHIDLPQLKGKLEPPKPCVAVINLILSLCKLRSRGPNPSHWTRQETARCWRSIG
jgi:hypothetical protein